jgi:hypothetical protein
MAIEGPERSKEVRKKERRDLLIKVIKVLFLFIVD